MNLKDLDKAEVDVCAALAGGAVFDVRFYNNHTGTVFEVSRQDGKDVSLAEGLALVMNAGMTVATRVIESSMAFANAEVV